MDFASVEMMASSQELKTILEAAARRFCDICYIHVSQCPHGLCYMRNAILGKETP
jgi:hypothetical protein